MIPDYIQDRIRTAPPAGAPVVSGTPPIVCFGPAEEANVATLGLNPSDKEYLDAEGNELLGSDRRLETLNSLGIGSLRDAPGEAVEAIYKGQVGYFERNPYRAWFDDLERALSRVGASYYDGSATHLDLVQWATSKKWGDLSAAEKETLLENGVPFLRKQLQEGTYQVLLLNGRGVMEAFEGRLEADLSVEERIDRASNGSQVELCVGSLPVGTQVIGWSANLQSTYGLTNEVKKEIIMRVGALSQEALPS